MGSLLFPTATLVVMTLSVVHQGVVSMDLFRGGNPDSGAAAETGAGTAARPGLLVLPDTFNDEDIATLICSGLQALVPSCRGVPTVGERFGTPGGRGADPTAAGAPVVRRKRSWGSFFPTSQPFPTSAPFHANFGSSRSLSNTGNAFLCPTQINQSMVYQFSPDSTDYPAQDIANELQNSPALTACLAREIINENDPPALIVDPFLLNSNASCPFTELRLWSYLSQAANARCFVLQNFQENILYKQCTSASPLNCKSKTTQTTGDPWGGLWPVGQTSNTNTLNINRCLPEYKRVSFWAYCPSLTAGQRIVRDRVIIPSACTPYSIPCEAIANTHPNTHW